MKAFLATVLSVIAAGVLLIAYGLLVPRAPMAAYPDARPMVASQRVGLIDEGYPVQGYVTPQPAPYGYVARPAVAGLVAVVLVGLVVAVVVAHLVQPPGRCAPGPFPRR